MKSLSYTPLDNKNWVFGKGEGGFEKEAEGEKEEERREGIRKRRKKGGKQTWAEVEIKFFFALRAQKAKSQASPTELAKKRLHKANSKFAPRFARQDGNRICLFLLSLWPPLGPG